MSSAVQQSPATVALTKRENLDLTERLLAGKTNAEGVVNRPLLLHLEITSRCNLRCLKCGHATDPRDSPRIQPRHLNYNIIESLDDYFAAAVKVHTFGYGEMFLYSKLRRLVERLKHYQCIVDGITNGVLVGKPEVDWLVEYGYDEITFSIDGFKPETMQRLRGVDVQKIWDTLEYLKERKRQMKKSRPRVVVNFVAQSDNYDELPDLTRKLSNLDLYFFGVNPLMPAETHGDPNDPYVKLYKEFGLENVPREKLEAAVEEARKIAEKAGMGFCAYIDFDALYGRRYGASAKGELLQILPTSHLDKVQQAQKLQPFYCSYPWTSMYVHANGSSRVCCYMEGSFGEIKDSADFNRAWTEGEIVDIRKAISEGEIHPACRSCVQLGRYQHSQTDLADIQRAVAAI